MNGLHFSLATFVPLERMMNDDAWKSLKMRAKLRLLRMHYEAGVGHIGGNLSSLDLMLVLFHQIMGPDDVFILSKGHAAGALYITLWTKGLLSESDLQQFHKDNTILSGHPPVRGIPQIPFATGSLGHGLSLASGMALAKRLKNEKGRVFCLMSDGEWNEGSCWEALAFASHQALNQLTILVDLNGVQGFGHTHEVMNLHPLAEKFRTYSVPTQEINGHDHHAMINALKTTASSPSMVVAATIKGQGISFMENRMEWHYLPLKEADYQRAVREVEAS